jgi:hypothetical protein
MSRLKIHPEHALGVPYRPTHRDVLMTVMMSGFWCNGRGVPEDDVEAKTIHGWKTSKKREIRAVKFREIKTLFQIVNS